MKVVHVTWLDSEAFSEWLEVDSMSHGMDTVHTVGFLIFETPDAYLIASSFDHGTKSVNAGIWIPRVCVVGFEILTDIITHPNTLEVPSRA